MGWARHELNVTPREAATLVRVAQATRRGMAATAAAFAAGELTLGQAAAVCAAVEQLSEDVPEPVRARAEVELVGYAARFDAVQLARLGRHILTVVAPQVGEDREAEQLERAERRARERRELYLTPDGQARCSCVAGSPRRRRRSCGPRGTRWPHQARRARMARTGAPPPNAALMP